MAKTPASGRSKTRLCPPLRPGQAAALSAAFISDMTGLLACAGAAAAIDGYLAYAPAGQVAALRPLAAPGTRFLLADGASVDDPGVEGFGRCLLETLRRLLDEGYGAACVLNSDSPTLPLEELLRAASLLRAAPAKVVIGPAEDGGYYLLGLNAPHAALFADIAWSTGTVARATLAAAARIGLPHVALTPWYDVDDPASLLRLRRDLARSAAIAPATRSALRAIDDELKTPETIEP